MLQPPPTDNSNAENCIKSLTQIYAQTQNYCQTIAIVKEQGRCYLDLGNRQPIWWYHPDHLGSSSYLTDFSGIPSHYYD